MSHLSFLPSSNLSNYKEASFTVTVSGSSSPGSGTYSFQDAYYWEIEDMVVLIYRISWSAHTGTGNLLLDLPVSVASDCEAAGTVMTGAINYDAGTQMVLRAIPSSTTAEFVCIGDGISANPQSMDTAASAFGSIMYRK